MRVGIWMVVGAVLAMPLLPAPIASAGPFDANSGWLAPKPGAGVPDPYAVPGKEYTDFLDKDTSPTPDPLQVIAWDGNGGVADSFDFTGTGVSGQVDALANTGDVLFQEVINDGNVCPNYGRPATLLFSVGTPPGPASPCAPFVYYEKPVDSPGSGTWANMNQIDQHGVTDVDALEVWGPNLQDDGDHFSLAGDPGLVSAFYYDFVSRASTPYLTALQAATIIGEPILADELDLDAMMLQDRSDPNAFDPNIDAIMFSIAPLNYQGMVYDGGEIWVYDPMCPYYSPVGPGGPGAFLLHGGHVWDTAFDVRSAFGLGTENVNALEAVPEPASLLLLVAGGMGLSAIRRRR